MNYYRLKTTMVAEKEDGAMEKMTVEELALVNNYTEAEALLYAIAEKHQRNKFGEISYDIVKTKIGDVLWNGSLTSDAELIQNLINVYFEEADDTGVGLYSVKVMFVETDEKTAKEKRTQENIYVPAKSNQDASEAVEQWLRHIGDTRYHVVRDVRYDKAESIYWPADTYQYKLSES